MAAKPPTASSPTFSDTPDGEPTEQPEQGGPSNRPKKSRRTVLTQHACARCRQKKSKCDGKRPICARCEKHGADCVYDVAQEGMTRMQSLQSQLGNMTDEHAKLKQLFEALRRGNDQESTTLLAKLRMGDSIDDLLAYLGQGSESPSSGQQVMRSPIDGQGGPDYNAQWPTSPTKQDGYWTSPSESSSRTGSQSTVPQLQTRLPPSDPALAYRGPDPQGPYYTSRSPQDAPQQNQDNYGHVQWQSQDGTVNTSPYYTNPPTSQLGKGKHSRDPER